MRSGVRIKSMNFLKAQSQIRPARRGCVLLAGILLVAAFAAGAAEPNRFLLVFETSPTLKKNLPAVKQTLDALLASNLQGEIQENDDLAVWTVDQNLHTGTYPLESWSRDDADAYGTQLKDFLGRQKFTRHASLAALQPLLNRVAKNSAQLTVLIFCDGQNNLVGTPYDSGVNTILKKTTVQSKVAPGLFVLVLRSYQGGYLGCSVNRMAGLLNFPKFPPPPKPEPPVTKPEPVIAPVAAPMAPLIIVGTNVGTNISALTKPAPQPAPPIVTNPPANIAPATPPAVAVVVAPVVATKIVTAPAANPAPASNPPPPPPFAPAPAPVVQKIFPPEPVAAVPAVVVPAKPPAATNSPAVASAGPDTSNDAGFQKLIFIAGGLLVAAVVLVIWLVTRSRQPRGSLITSSMQDDPRLPPRK
jgi:hypothetical protein